ncbi:hypothetical protein AB0K00_27345 [Dactylosporangium sp. NPDC049525]|uniref:hypothetical protein n=1 Tax=Dactylosporangium sp. NPDC049525 TaxID=3154730 RepID=UPI00343FDC70
MMVGDVCSWTPWAILSIVGAPRDAMNSPRRRPFSDEPESPVRRAMFWLRVIVTAGFATLFVVTSVTRDPSLLGGGGSVTVNGSVVLNAAYGFYDNDRHCRGIGDYSDVTEGAHLTLADDAAQVLGVHGLGPGTPNGMLGSVSGPCTFDFRIEGVALGGEFYTFTVAGQHAIQVRPRELRKHVLLSLVR